MQYFALGAIAVCRWNGRQKWNDYVSVKKRLARRFLFLFGSSYFCEREMTTNGHDSWRIEIEKIYIFGCHQLPYYCYVLTCTYIYRTQVVYRFHFRFNNLQNGQRRIAWFINCFIGPNARPKSDIVTIIVLGESYCCWGHLKRAWHVQKSRLILFYLVLRVSRRPVVHTHTHTHGLRPI